MPVTVRGKASETGAKKDGAADSKVDPKRPLSGSKEQTRSTDSPKPSTARQRARDRRRERAEASPERTSPSPDASAGRIKNLTGFWSTPKEEVQSVRKKRLEISERKAEDAESESETDSDDSDDREEIKRAQESAPTDRNDLVEIEKGRAKSMASIFQNRKDDDESKKKKTPFKLDITSEEPTVFENEPEVREGIAKADDASTARDEIVVGRPGRIKDLAVNFASICSKPRSDDSSDSDDHAKNSTKKEGETIEKGKIQNVRQRWQKRQQKSASSGRGTKDSDADVSDSSDDEPTAAPPPPSRTKSENVIEQKKVKNIRDRWTRRQEGSEEKDEEKEKTEAKKTPAKVPLRPLDTAKEYGVFENEPVVREDVVRADDDQPDVISCVRTKKLRRMWTNMEKEVTKDAKHPAEANVRVVEKTKKKEAKQEPEPEAAKKTTPSSKSQKAIAGRYQEATATTADQGKGKEQQRGGEGKGKLQKAFTVAAAATASPEEAAVKPSAPKSPSLARYSSRKKNV